MENFIYNIPTKVAFGKNQIQRLPEFIKEFGNRALIVYGGGSIKKIGIYEKLISLLSDAGIYYEELAGVEPNPRITTVQHGIEMCRRSVLDVVVPVGGGSTIDCAKAISAGVFFDGDPWDMVKNQYKIERALPVITISTIAATGSEMDQLAVISNDKTNDKLCIGSDILFPKYSILDPQYTFSVSKYQTASGIADIMSHVFEVYLNGNRGLDIQIGMMEEILKTCIKYGPILMEKPDNYDARANIMWASSWAINGFISYGIRAPWPCHAMEHQLSAYYNVTHGHGLAILTPVWMEYIKKPETLQLFVRYGVNVWKIDDNLENEQIAAAAIEKTRDFFDRMELSNTLSSIGISDESKFDEMADKACVGLDHCKVPILKQDVIEIYRKCL